MLPTFYQYSKIAVNNMVIGNFTLVYIFGLDYKSCAHTAHRLFPIEYKCSSSQSIVVLHPHIKAKNWCTGPPPSPEMELLTDEFIFCI